MNEYSEHSHYIRLGAFFSLFFKDLHIKTGLHLSPPGEEQMNYQSSEAPDSNNNITVYAEASVR